MSKYGVISGSYFPVFSPNTGKYGPEITPYLETFHPVSDSELESQHAVNTVFETIEGIKQFCKVLLDEIHIKPATGYMLQITLFYFRLVSQKTLHAQYLQFF